MAHFYEYLQGLAQRRSFHKTFDGGMVQYRFALPKGTLVEVTCHELDPSFTCLVQSEPWAVPLNHLEKQHFMRNILKGNRSALHFLTAGVVEDFDNPSVYRLIWFVPRGKDMDQKWYESLLEFDKLYQAFDKVLNQQKSLTGMAIDNNSIAHGQFQIFTP